MFCIQSLLKSLLLTLAQALLLAAGPVMPALALTGTAHGTATTPSLSPHAPAAPADLLQFTSGSHVLGFAPDRMYLSNGTYALRVEFVGANRVAPQAADKAAAAPPLSRVSYPDLWPGITLTYDAQQGLARSTYTLAPGADPAAIRLRYNVPLAVDAAGGLRMAYETGELRESAPIAWQEIGGRRVGVEVAFQTAGAAIGFRLGRYDPRYPLVIDPTLTWHTFLGGSNYDHGGGIAVDGSGGVYVVGHSDANWGSDPAPVRDYTGGPDVFVARLGSDGALTWHTFLGGGGLDYGRDIAVDGSGVYVVGYSTATWGSNPVRAYTADMDAFVARLDSNNGALTWHTFLGGSDEDRGHGIAVDGSSGVYVAGNSTATWGSPLNAYAGGYYDGYVARLDGDGALAWHTFLGGGDIDASVAVDGDGNAGVYVAGESRAAWGSPVRTFSGSDDVFVAKLGSDGALTWHTFLGGDGVDTGGAVALDGSGGVYVVGTSWATWGSPVRAYTADRDAFVARLGSDGALAWHTFLGGDGGDGGFGIAVDGSDRVYVAGESRATWGSPARDYTAGSDAFVATLGSDGALIWNAFLGSSGADGGSGIAVDGSGSVYVVGSSGTTWSDSPKRPHAGLSDAFVARLDVPILGLAQSVSPSAARPGEAITYTIQFSNTGSLTATNVVLTDRVPVSLTQVSVLSSGVALTDTGAVPAYVWQVADLGPGQGGVITLTGVLTRPLAAGVFTHSVTLSADGVEERTDAGLAVQNVVPVADAGLNQAVNAHGTVTLEGSGADDNGGMLTYGWTQTGGPAVVLSDPAAARPTFTAPAAAAVLTLTLTITDTGGLAGTDQVVVTVRYSCYLPIVLKNVAVPQARRAFDHP